jgi:hypothetical protein
MRSEPVRVDELVFEVRMKMGVLVTTASRMASAPAVYKCD